MSKEFWQTVAEAEAHYSTLGYWIDGDRCGAQRTHMVRREFDDGQRIIVSDYCDSPMVAIWTLENGRVVSEEY